MLKEIPDKLWLLIYFLIIMIFIVTLTSVMNDYSLREAQVTKELKLNMAAKGYCLRPINGTSELQYQPCQLKEY